MALDFTDVTGNLFNRLGKLFKLVEDVETYQQTTLDNAFVDQFGQYNGDAQLIEGGFTDFDASRDAAGGIKSDNFARAEATVIKMVNDDNRQPLDDIDTALLELIRQLDAAAATVNASTPGISTAPDAANNGDGVVLSAVENGKGESLENVLGEDVVLDCTSDSQPGRGTLQIGSEVFTAQGELDVDKSSFEFPKGSNTVTQIPVSNPAAGPSTNNFLTNSDFEDFTVADTPDSWVLDVGVAGAGIQETATAFSGVKALEFFGDGAELTRISQSLRAAPATQGLFEPEKRYALAFQVRVSAAPSAGVLRVSLRETSSGAQIGDDVSVDLTTVGVVYVSKSVQINTPDPLPDTVFVVIELTTALESGKSVFIDHMALVEMTQHANGPLFAIFPGAIKWLVDDRVTAAVTNDRAGKFQEFFERAFDMTDKGLLLPSNNAGGETILDTLIG